MIYCGLWYQGVPELGLGLLLMDERNCVTSGAVGLVMQHERVGCYYNYY